jgi:hypothetical protein
LFVECVCIHCFDWSLVSTFTNETKVLSPVPRTMWENSVWNFWKFTRSSEMWSAVFHNFFSRHFEQDYYSVQMTDQFTLHCEHLYGGKRWSRDGVVGIATGYGLDDRRVRVRFPEGSRIFCSPRHRDRLWSPPNLLSNGYQGLFPRG